MSISNKLIGITPTAGGVEPVGIDFDGTNDYLSRSSDLTGNADGKTFTFSAWVYLTKDTLSDNYIYSISDGSVNSGTISFTTDSGGPGRVNMNFYNASGTRILQTSAVTNYLSQNTWLHVLISVDLSNASNRYIYVNDEEVSVSWSTYTDDLINFTNTQHFIAGLRSSLPRPLEGRLTGVYLDYTYRDLSVEANRRDFIDADGRYVTPPTTGIISVPMDDPEDPGRNDGTGGDFTLNGTIAQSGRGPNQYNAPASTFVADTDWLQQSGDAGAASGKVFTFSCIAKPNPTNSAYVFTFFNSTTPVFEVRLRWDAGAYYVLEVKGNNGSDLNFFTADTDLFPLYAYTHFAFSVDMTSQAALQVFINGEEITNITVNDFVDANINFETATTVNVANQYTAAGGFEGEISDLWFDTTYIDLSADNPFYDSETGKPKDLGVDGSNPTGSAPLIYLPLRADDAGSNKGTGGDFTVNSGPYTGARGPSEYWAGSAEFDGSTGYLSRSSALVGAQDGKQVTLACSAYWNANTLDSVLTVADSGEDVVFRLYARPDGDQCKIDGLDATGSLIFEADFTLSSSASQWLNFLISFDLTNAANRHLYVDSTDVSPSWGTYANTDILFSSGQNIYLAATRTGSVDFDGKIGFLWFNTEYIDFSQEANRLKFFDAFGYPVDLGEDGSLPTGNQPLIYMNNDFHLGTNLGSGGDFTPVNTPTDGGFVKG